MFIDLRKMNLFSLVGAGLLFVSVLFPWWGLDISGPGYSFRWTVWGGPLTNLAPPQPYSEVNNLSQILTPGTAIMGTLALEAALLLFLGLSSKRSKFLRTGFAVAGLASVSYVGITALAVGVAHSAYLLGCISGTIGSCLDTSQGSTMIWGFQAGFYLLIAGTATALAAVIFDIEILRSSRANPESRT